MLCPVHRVKMVCACPACGGSATSKAKARAARRNGLKGGRPRKNKRTK